jgi:uncharacterized repeat protein (TIGR02543 family)
MQVLYIDQRGYILIQTAEVKLAASELIYNQKITPPETPTKEGYTFAGWYKDFTLTIPWDFDNDVYTGDIAHAYAAG